MDYTEGNWKVCNCNGTYFPTADIHILGVGNTEKEQCIATLSYHHKRDAQLIASAPNLYEALKAWDELREMHPLDSGADINEIFWKCCEITDKALAKAEGK